MAHFVSCTNQAGGAHNQLAINLDLIETISFSTDNSTIYFKSTTGNTYTWIYPSQDEMIKDAAKLVHSKTGNNGGWSIGA